MKRQTTHALLVLTAALGITLFSSCTPVTPQARIEKNPQLYQNLPKKHQSLVQQGRIKKNMHKDGVFLAWGRAQSVIQGNKDNKYFERWVYTSASPVYYNSFYPYFGYGRGSRCRRGGYYGFGIRPEVTYIQRQRASVSFDKYGKVQNWQRLK